MSLLIIGIKSSLKLFFTLQNLGKIEEEPESRIKNNVVDIILSVAL